MKEEFIGQLRVWWTTNIPNRPFHVVVDNLEHAKSVLELFADYNLHLGDLVDSNIGGLEVLEEDGWCDWMDEEGRGIDEIEMDELV